MDGKKGDTTPDGWFDTVTAAEAGRSVLPMWVYSPHVESIIEASSQALIPTTPNIWEMIRDARGLQNWDAGDSRFPTTSEMQTKGYCRSLDTGQETGGHIC